MPDIHTPKGLSVFTELITPLDFEAVPDGALADCKKVRKRFYLKQATEGGIQVRCLYPGEAFRLDNYDVVCWASSMATAKLVACLYCAILEYSKL